MFDSVKCHIYMNITPIFHGILLKIIFKFVHRSRENFIHLFGKFPRACGFRHQRASRKSLKKKKRFPFKNTNDAMSFTDASERRFVLKGTNNEHMQQTAMPNVRVRYVWSTFRDTECEPFKTGVINYENHFAAWTCLPMEPFLISPPPPPSIKKDAFLCNSIPSSHRIL